jgi:hypothetical protein
MRYGIWRKFYTNLIHTSSLKIGKLGPHCNDMYVEKGKGVKRYRTSVDLPTFDCGRVGMIFAEFLIFIILFTLFFVLLNKEMKII